MKPIEPPIPPAPRKRFRQPVGDAYTTSVHRLMLYLKLIRIDKPIGILLLLWPTLTALWLASDGLPDGTLVAVFTVGTILMRSAGCAVNDFADRNIDRHVRRTAARPLTTGAVAPWEALLIAAFLAMLSFGLVVTLNDLTKLFSVAALLIAATYPYFKRFFAIPQAYLGIAFGFGIPMAFAAVTSSVPITAWWLLLANVFWAIAYDTEYAMVDREDDLKIGIRSSAITFGRFDVTAIMVCYALALGIISIVGWTYGLKTWFMVGMLVAAGCALYHYWLIRRRDPASCFIAFRHNNWLGAAIFVGIALDYATR
jgi:4-hydroxybenzoate polyprenyltransferase